MGNSSPRSMPVAELAELAVDVFGEERVHVAGRMDEAITLAVDLVEAGSDDVAGTGVIITGSVVVPHYLGRIPDPVYRRGVSTAMSTVLGGLRTQGFVAAVAGALLAVAGFTGATLARRQLVAAPTWRPTGAPVAGPELSQPTRILDAPPYQSEPLYRPEQQYQPERQ